MQIRFTGLQQQARRLRAEIDRRISTVLDHGQFIMGPEVGELERQLSAFCGARETITVANGTDALLIALMAIKTQPDDAIFIPSFTFTATAEVALLLNARPVFVDVDPTSFNIDCDDLERCIDEVAQSGGRPKAIMAVDLFGLPADWARLHEIADRRGLILIGDAAQSFGGALNGKRVGALAPVTATSFFPAKPLGCYGDGGALFTDDPDLAKLMRSIRVHGQGDAKYDTARVGVNSRLDTLQAAILLAKLSVLDEEVQARDRVARAYSDRLVKVVATPVVPAGYASAWAQFTIKVDNRSEVVARLTSAGVPTAIYYPRPMHLQPAFAAWGDGAGSLPVSEKLAGQVLSLPLDAYASDAEIDYVCDSVANAVAGN